jgi:hypothetical protein
MTFETDALQQGGTLAHTSVAPEASTVPADTARDAPIDTGWMRLLHRHAIDSRDDDVPLADRTPVHDAPPAGPPPPGAAAVTPPGAIRNAQNPGTTDDGDAASATRHSTFLTATALALCALLQLLLIDVLVTPGTGDTRDSSVRTAPAAVASPSMAILWQARNARAPAPVVPEVSQECRAGAVVDSPCTFQ